MKKIISFIFLVMSVATTYAQVPIEYTKDTKNRIDYVMTSKFFVIENLENSFVTGNMIVCGRFESNEHLPLLGIIFEDYSDQDRSDKLLKKRETPITLIFEDNTKLSASASIRKGYGGFDPVCLDIVIAEFKQPGESSVKSKERNSRNISILISKNIKKIEFDGGSIVVKSEAVSDPLLKSSSLIKSMITELRNRYPSNPYLK
ncbi:MAG: hypothetical protein E7079_02020 [Bacteroidales bacterium]|nr:hypothetical protein [Bacteroidales bacterium]